MPTRKESAVRSILFALLLVAGSASAELYQCPAPVSESAAGCTFVSVGGTTTFTVNASAQATGSTAAGSQIALFMSLDGLPCNANSGVRVPIATTANVNGTCTFDVTSTHSVDFLAVAPVFNATPRYINVVANSVAFAPDFVLDVAVVGGGTVASSDGKISCGEVCSHSFSPGATVTLVAAAAPGSAFARWSGACESTAPTCTVSMNAAQSVIAHFFVEVVPAVVEFYHAPSDRYFLTASAEEAVRIDNGAAGAGWTRTGLSFKPGGNVPVCRFYGSLTPGPNSHFYTALVEECEFLKQLQITSPAALPRWNLEGITFSTQLPVNGLCPPFTLPVYRAYNNGFTLGKDSNHRLTTSPDALQHVVAQGWVYEGIAMCAPQ